jgi:uncharacterized protein (TIGR00661 family)
MVGKMAKILYAINGEGMGHATRSAAIIDELKERHKIRVIVASSRPYPFLKKKFTNVHKYEGLRIQYKDNKVDDRATVKDFLKKTVKNMPSAYKKAYKIIRQFKPDIILTDLEGVSATLGSILNIPVVCICNNHAVTKLKYKVPRKYYKDYGKAVLALKTIFSRADYHLITTFFKLQAKSSDTTLFPPILRKNILGLKCVRKDYFLVYQTSSTNNMLINTLKNIDEKFIVYGFDKDEKDKNITFRKFNDEQFLKDFSQCRACISNGGFSLVSEAVAMHKPVLSIPIKGQFEQILNALYIERLGYGEFHEEANEKNILHFIKNCDKCYENVKKYNYKGNSEIIDKIEEIIKKECQK